MYPVVRETWRATSGAIQTPGSSALRPTVPRAESSARAIYDSLRSRIVGGQLAPGERVTELQLSEQFGVSRAPLREAVRALAAESLLTELPTGGIRITTLDTTEARRVYELRSRLEGLLARDACERAMPNDGVHLRRLADSMNRAALDAEAMARLDAQFHGHIEEMADNRWCSALLGQIRGQVDRYRAFAARERVSYTDYIAGHLAIAEAVSGRDLDAAERAVRDHFDRCARRVAQALQYTAYQPTGAIPVSMLGRHRRR